MKRSKHNLSHSHNFTCSMGELIPCGIVEVLPGDTFNHSTSLLVRTTPLVAPLMHATHAEIHHWYVPHRIIWNGWEAFITGTAETDGLPFFDFSGNIGAGGLSDYLGLPTGSAALGASTAISTLPFKAYNLVFNEWYRDEQLTDERNVNKDAAGGVAESGEGITSTSLARVAWHKDRFTSARVDPQFGDAVTIPIDTEVNAFGPFRLKKLGEEDRGSQANTVYTSGGTYGPVDSSGLTTNDTMQYESGLQGGDATVTVEAFRQAFALQRFQEARNRYGSRYVEYLRYLGVRSSDGRLDRPEYLGGGKQTLQFSEVLDTGSSAGNVGKLKGHGIAALRSNRYQRFFEEHGYVISMLVVRPTGIYLNGIPRHFLKSSFEEFYQKELGHLGMQPIWKAEVDAGHLGTGGAPKDAFAYQDAYDEYRKIPSRASGEFSAAGTKKNWMFARDFATQPELNNSFVECLPPNAAFADTAVDQLQVMVHHSLRARRIIPQVGTPTAR